jgi:hypothetical protein
MPDTDGGPLKKGGRACKAGGGPIAERNGSTYSNGKLDGRAMNKREIEEMADEDQANERDNDADDQFAARVEAGKALAGRKAGGRTERKAGGRVKGKTNINIIIAPRAAVKRLRLRRWALPACRSLRCLLLLRLRPLADLPALLRRSRRHACESAWLACPRRRSRR